MKVVNAAKELGISSKEYIEFANSIGYAITHHGNNISEDNVIKIKNRFLSKEPEIEGYPAFTIAKLNKEWVIIEYSVNKENFSDVKVVKIEKDDITNKYEAMRKLEISIKSSQLYRFEE